jgi:hypothetical protein
MVQCNPRYSGGRERRVTFEGQPRQKLPRPCLRNKWVKSMRPSLKNSQKIKIKMPGELWPWLKW